MTWSAPKVGSLASSNTGTVAASVASVAANDELFFLSVLYNATATITGVSVSGDSTLTALTAVPGSKFTGTVGGTPVSVELWRGKCGSGGTKTLSITDSGSGVWSGGGVIAVSPSAGTVAMDGAAAGTLTTGDVTLTGSGSGLLAESLSIGVMARTSTPPTPTNYTAFPTDDPVEASSGFYRLNVPGGNEVIAVDALGVFVALKITAGAAGQISHINGIALSSISHINGIAKASISHFNGLTTI